MKLAADTNVLVRAVVRDDPIQARAADEVLRQAQVIAVSLASLCELVWVLRRVYRLGRDQIAAAIGVLAAAANVAVDRAGVEAGLAILRAGGDFADGVIAHEGRWLGGETFVSFDARAISLAQAQGQAARLIG